MKGGGDDPLLVHIIKKLKTMNHPTKPGKKITPIIDIDFFIRIKIMARVIQKNLT